jgi:hypothetical protein
MLVSNTDSGRNPTEANAFHTLNPRMAAIKEPPIDHPVLRPK